MPSRSTAICAATASRSPVAANYNVFTDIWAVLPDKLYLGTGSTQSGSVNLATDPLDPNKPLPAAAQ